MTKNQKCKSEGANESVVWCLFGGGKKNSRSLFNKTSFLFMPLVSRKKLKSVVASLAIFYHKFDFLN